jgi:hypothetical protein
MSRAENGAVSLPGGRDYQLVSLVALLFLAALLFNEGMSWSALIPAAAGAVAVLVGWSIGPPLVLLLVSVLYVYWSRPWYASLFYAPGLQPVDLGVAGALLAYIAGHYRALSLRKKGGPDEGPRWRRQGPPRRSPALVTGAEVLFLLLTVGGCVVVAFAFLAEGAEKVIPTAFRSEPRVGLVIGLAWLIGVFVAVAAAVLGYWRWSQASPREEMLYLQDQAWSATRSEQRQLNRWLAWARQQFQRRKEGG